MTAALPFRRLIHCDWSVGPAKRWRADAVRQGGGWWLTLPCPVGDLAGFVADLFMSLVPVLAGFDLPIGLPDAIGRRTGAPGFIDLLPRLGVVEPWLDYFRVGREASEVSLHRPFFPDRWKPGLAAAALTDALDVADLDALRRRCERRHPGRRVATPLFWTVGPAQVGKAAISGWRDVIRPAIDRGARLWPFDGALTDLAVTGAPVLAETYPGDAYGRVGIAFDARQSKRRAVDRRIAASGVPAFCRDRAIGLAPDLAAAIADGFERFGAAGEDAFDTLAGLLGMIDVAEGRCAAAPPEGPVLPWEGWILGRSQATAVMHHDKGDA